MTDGRDPEYWRGESSYDSWKETGLVRVSKIMHTPKNKQPNNQTTKQPNNQTTKQPNKKETLPVCLFGLSSPCYGACVGIADIYFFGFKCAQLTLSSPLFGALARAQEPRLKLLPVVCAADFVRTRTIQTHVNFCAHI